MKKLENKKVAILAENGFEEVELLSPKEALENAGATVEIVSTDQETIKSWRDGDWGQEVKVDRKVSEVNAQDYDALMIPGGAINPDKLRRNDDAVRLATEFLESGKPVASICHGPQLLIETMMLEGRKMTSFPSISTDLKNAGVQWVDAEVVVDQGLVTSRNPDDLPAFNRKMVEEFAEGIHQAQNTI